MVDPPVDSAAAEHADSTMQFCLDFAALLDARQMSLRAAEARSGWGRSTIAAARKGPALPNVELVVDVLAAIGESAPTCAQWRERHDRLVSRAAGPAGTRVVEVGPAGDGSGGNGEGDRVV